VPSLRSEGADRSLRVRTRGHRRGTEALQAQALRT